MTHRRVDHDLYRGALGIAVLALLSEQESHGYALAERLASRSGGAMRMSEGAVYPLLHRLEQRGLVTARWERTRKNRRAKMYAITPKGESWLQRRSDQWQTVSDALMKILQPPRYELGGG